jgi:hypothetical protein
MVEVKTNIITTRTPPAKSNSNPLHTLAYDKSTSEQVGCASVGCVYEGAKMCSKTESK